MLENCLSGSEGGVALIPPSLPLSEAGAGRLIGDRTLKSPSTEPAFLRDKSRTLGWCAVTTYLTRLSVIPGQCSLVSISVRSWLN